MEASEAAFFLSFELSYLVLLTINLELYFPTIQNFLIDFFGKPNSTLLEKLRCDITKHKTSVFCASDVRVNVSDSVNV